ncbi:thiazole tautomerase TenI [Neobacillus sp. SAB-20_R2A]|uniref:thiazole tautomerase TenI n=1 Tax=Neobacillus sp. SAB-20_R2A TaxID=3120519 RepID=UPI003C6E752C
MFCLFCASLDQRNPFKGGSCIFTSLKEKELHLISNGKMSIHQLAEIAKDIHPFVTALHLREKQKSAKELFQAVELLTNVNVPLSKIVINDRVDVAIVAKALGVQLAYHSLDTACVKEHFPQLRVGTSIHSYEEGKNAKENGADFVLYGHVFPSQSKPGKTPKGLEELTRLSQLNIPVIAIGGITPENTEEVLQAGATGIAVMSGVLDARDPLLAVKSYIHAFRDGGGKYGSYI